MPINLPFRKPAKDFGRSTEDSVSKESQRKILDHRVFGEGRVVSREHGLDESAVVNHDGGFAADPEDEYRLIIDVYVLVLVVGHQVVVGAGTEHDLLHLCQWDHAADYGNRVRAYSDFESGRTTSLCKTHRTCRKASHKITPQHIAFASVCIRCVYMCLNFESVLIWFLRWLVLSFIFFSRFKVRSLTTSGTQ